MPIKDKNKTLVIIRNTPYSGFNAFLQDVFYRDKFGLLAAKAFELLKKIYQNPLPVKKWAEHVASLFNVQPLSKQDEAVIDSLCFKHFGFHRENLNASKSKLRGKKPYQLLLEKNGKGNVKLSDQEVSVIKKVNSWHSAITSYYSIINKLKAIGLIDKREGFYQKSSKFKKRFAQLIDLVSGFENESK